jgi:hypothetical protein
MTARLRELTWIIDHRRDVMADLRVFARLSWAEALAMPGPELMALCWRLPVYGGAVAVLQARQTQGNGHRVRPADRVLPSTRAALMSSPDLRGVISFGSADG